MAVGARTTVRDALDILLAGQQDDPRILVGDDVVPHSIAGIGGRTIESRGLAKAIRAGAGTVKVVVAVRLDPTAIRAMREHPPALAILTGPEQAEVLADIRSIRTMSVLGPVATLTVGEGSVLACGLGAEQLEELVAALGGARLALSPTPAWLPEWLAALGLAECRAVGFVAADVLTPDWLAWADRACLAPGGRSPLLIPLGVGRAELDRPRQAGLESIVAAHALEQVSGPIHPAADVLALLIGKSSEPGALDEAIAAAVWQQARRALPRIGETPGMQAPLPEFDLAVPTATFMAQRTLLRIREAERLLGQRPPDEPAPGDPAGVQRAETVLEGATELLSDHDSKVVLRGHGIEVTRQAFANSSSGAAAFADKIGYPVVLKALSPDLRRKSEIGAVELDVGNAAGVKRAYARIVGNVEERAPSVRLDGVVVAEMIASGLDLRCGGLRMRSGGVALFAQPLLDAVIEPVVAASPLSPTRALLLAESALAHVLVRRRAEDPDVRVLASLLLRIDRLFRHTGSRLLHVDLNPVRLIRGERQYVTLDARIVQRPHLQGT